MLGLKKDFVQLSDYNPQWAKLYNKERHLIDSHIGNFVLDIQHIGSTSIPGLKAKPIIDIAIKVKSSDEIYICAKTLTKVGFINRGDTEGQGGYLLVKEKAPRIRTHHIHIVSSKDPQWRDYLIFRELLREKKDFCEKYLQLKQDLQERFPFNRKQYTIGKSKFIQKLIENHFVRKQASF